ncbi:hypothetical protein BGW36DRAFT_41789 [Talaromyces proteolyticus]|uniref:Uncharacterized protein n=1 Tax=Talaromyces proteolyticus TaxID=1131652 RepID=A0AAD4PWW9_9EURO|nr:uncharacterized protein BGW36DRAFT_41789 [Talaromyces proteolyticus]KAH8692099.1 hypothetical protein BGW36DRAFT_41789 [Talaromyces proteolyticus]
MHISQTSDQLSSSPKAFPNCCLAISSSFISTIASILPKKPSFTASIGSGSGFLEALITHRHPNVYVEGVEVNDSVNRYISEDRMNVVAGTWDLHPRVSKAKAWLFVYPREPKLIMKYIDTYGGHGVEMIIWLGPQADWPEYELHFCQSSFSNLNFPEESGLAPYEIMAIARRKPC